VSSPRGTARPTEARDAVASDQRRGVFPHGRPLWRDGSTYLLGEANIEYEVPEPQVEQSSAGPVDDERQQDDGQYGDHHPEEKHDDAGNGIPRYSSRSSHGRQLPATGRVIRAKALGKSDLSHDRPRRARRSHV
jgi:hypothetical protein